MNPGQSFTGSVCRTRSRYSSRSNLRSGLKQISPIVDFSISYTYHAHGDLQNLKHFRRNKVLQFIKNCVSDGLEKL